MSTRRVNKELSDVGRAVERLEFGLERLKEEAKDVYQMAPQMAMIQRDMRREANDVSKSARREMNRQVRMQAAELGVDVPTSLIKVKDAKKRVQEEAKRVVVEEAMNAIPDDVKGTAGDVVKAAKTVVQAKKKLKKIKEAAKDAKTAEDVADAVADEVTEPLAAVPVVGTGMAAAVKVGTDLGVKAGEALGKTKAVKKASKALHKLGAKRRIGKFNSMNICRRGFEDKCDAAFGPGNYRLA